jgi:protein-L-isoaspartate(D-aspartate) O-methyltransferase
MIAKALQKFQIQILLIVMLLACAHAVMADDYAAKRRAMVRSIEADVRSTSLYLDKEELDSRVLDALREVPRHLFVPENVQDEAYENRALPIGHGQTISQPYIVAVMTDLLKPRKHMRTLEVGTGSGYQAAVLAKLTANVYTIEIIEPLAQQARQRLKMLGYDNVEVRHGDGYYGWEEHAPFDLIVVTAASSHIPPPLIPVGSPFLVQQLVLVEKDQENQLTLKQILPVQFVPLTGEHEECNGDCIDVNKQ